MWRLCVSRRLFVTGPSDLGATVGTPARRRVAGIPASRVRSTGTNKGQRQTSVNRRARTRCARATMFGLLALKGGIGCLNTIADHPINCGMIL
jgi:hypothetical protein